MDAPNAICSLLSVALSGLAANWDVFLDWTLKVLGAMHDMGILQPAAQQAEHLVDGFQQEAIVPWPLSEAANAGNPERNAQASVLALQGQPGAQRRQGGMAALPNAQLSQARDGWFANCSLSSQEITLVWFLLALWTFVLAQCMCIASLWRPRYILAIRRVREVATREHPKFEDLQHLREQVREGQMQDPGAMNFAAETLQ